MFKICIDPGHGGKDPGAIGPSGLRESEVVLSISLTTAEELKKLGYTVYITRTDNHFVSLQDRANFANKIKSDIFVSIHANASVLSTAHGTEVYHYPESSKGIQLARIVLKRLIQDIKLGNRGVKPGTFYVLKYTIMPAILIETAFITNPEEEKLLAMSLWREKIGKAISAGIHSYFTEGG